MGLLREQLCCWSWNPSLTWLGWERGKRVNRYSPLLISFFFCCCCLFCLLIFFFSLLGFSYCGIYEWNNIISHCFSCLKYLSVKQRQCGRWTFKLKLNLRLFNTSRGMSSVLFSNLKDNKWKGSQIICKCWRNCFQETETNFLFVTLA